MSSLRNAVKRKTHKERGQVASRKKYGLLEKHKDYVLRARDYNKKRDRMNALKLKAALRNPDEFYFGMNKAKTKDGVHTDEKSTALNPSVVQLLKTQDVGYVRMKESVDRKKAEKMKASLHMLGGEASKANKHTIFLESSRDAREFDAAKHFDTVPELADRAFNRPRKATLESQQILGASNRKHMKRALKQQETAYRELGDRLTRADELASARVHLEAQKTVMTSKGTKRKIKGAEGKNPAVFKWKRQRSR
ncbi:unnamed protein product [Chrysoparadoxa australica]